MLLLWYLKAVKKLCFVSPPPFFYTFVMSVLTTAWMCVNKSGIPDSLGLRGQGAMLTKGNWFTQLTWQSKRPQRPVRSTDTLIPERLRRHYGSRRATTRGTTHKSQGRVSTATRHDALLLEALNTRIIPPCRAHGALQTVQYTVVNLFIPIILCITSIVCKPMMF